MISPLFVSIFFAALMFGLLIEAYIFQAIHADPPSTYKLFAVRDLLTRLVIEGKIQRDEPHFSALYQNVNILLRASRCLSGPSGWRLAEEQGKFLARHPHASQKLTELPREQLPESLQPAVNELRIALTHLLDNHFGVFVQVDSRRRELARMQREQAKALLNMVSCPT